MSLNNFNFVGNLGRDAEVKQVGQSTVCNFAVAVTSGYGENKKTTWVSCALWGKAAEGALPTYLLKGQQVAVSGELSTREYQANDGTTKTVVEVRCSSVGLVGKRDDSQPRPAPQQQPAPQPQQQPQYSPQPQRQAPENYDDDIPF